MEHTVTPMHCGTLVIDKGEIMTVGVDAGTDVAIPSISFLIEGESDVEPMIVDTSFGDIDLMAHWHPDFQWRRPHGHTVTERLDARGYAPTDIETVVLSHLDTDHCCNLDQFTHADMYVQRAEAVDRFEDFDPEDVGLPEDWEPPWADVDLTSLDGESELAPGLVLFPTPGHTIGHQSLEVETADGTTVVAVDAVPLFENLDDQTGEPVVRNMVTGDESDWWTSAEEVVERADILLPGHEWDILDVQTPADATP